MIIMSSGRTFEERLKERKIRIFKCLFSLWLKGKEIAENIEDHCKKYFQPKVGNKFMIF